MFFERHPGLRPVAAAVSLAAALAMSACKPGISRAEVPLDIDEVVLVYAHGIEGSVKIEGETEEGIVETFDSALDRIHDITGELRNDIPVRVAGRLSLEESTGAMSDVCTEDDRDRLYDTIIDQAKEEYGEELGDKDFLAVVLQKEPGFECDEAVDERQDDEDFEAGARATFHSRQMVIFDGDEVSRPAGTKKATHELAHALFGLPHGDRIDCHQVDGVTSVSEACEVVRYGNTYTATGGASVLTNDYVFSAFDILKMGKIDESQVKTIGEPGEHAVRLFSLDNFNNDDTKIVRVPLGAEDLSLEFYSNTPVTALYVELNHVELTGSDVTSLRVRCYLVNEDSLNGGRPKANYLLVPDESGQSELVSGDSVVFKFLERTASIEVTDIQRYSGISGFADLRLTLR